MKILNCGKRKILHSLISHQSLLAMKFTLLLLTIALLNVNAKSFSQQISFKGKDVSLENVFSVIKQQTGYSFFYNDQDIANSKTVTVNFKNTQLVTALNELLKNQPFTYNIQRRTIVITHKSSVVTSAEEKKKTNPIVTPPPPIEVNGIITDDNGNVVPGASITLKGTNIGTSSDDKGFFKLVVPNEKSILVFSFVGYEEQEITVGSKNNFAINLHRVIAQFSDVVVIGYGTVKRKDLTGAVSSVKAKDITAIPVSNALEVLQGKISGMDISKSDGEAGAGVKVNLRGNRSLTASNDPLILVDGIPYGSTLDINTSDIESMEVLKDASSTAIYGSRGANGVILITTKKGRSGKASISFSSYYGSLTPAQLPEIQNGDQYAAFKREAFRTQGITDDLLIFNPGELQAINNKTYTNWMDEVIKNGSVQNNEINVTGGTDKATYNMSFGAYSEKGLFKNDDLKRYNGSLGATIKLYDNLKIGANIIYTHKDNNRRLDPLNQANKIYPFGKPYDDNGNIVLYPVLGQTFAISPLADEIEGAFVDNRIGKRIFTSSFLDWKIIKNLSFRSTIGLDIQNDRRGYYLNKNTIQQNGGQSTSGIEINNTNNYTWENTLTYNKVIGKHDLNFLLGNSYIKNSLESVQASGSDQVSDINTYYNLASNSNSVAISSSLVESNLQSVFGRINYKLLGKYLFTASLRADGASVLAKGNKWASFPSIAAAWKISDESFMQNAKVVSNLKLRLSYGISGNSAVLPYQTLGSLGRSVYAFDETAAYGYYPKDISNPDLKWEKTATANIGIDFGFLNNRITGSVEYYQSKTSDLLLQRILPTSSGFSSILENVGKTENKGFELSLSTQNIISAKEDGFKWSTDFTYFRNKEKIVELAGGVTRDLANGWFVGEATQVYYDYSKVGIWQLGEETAAAVYGQKPGDIKVADLNTDNQITNADDRKVVGSARPKYSFGINNNLSYKNFDFSVFVYGKIGQTILNEASGNYKISGLENGAVVDYWTPENPTNSHPRPDKNKTSNSAFMSTLYYANGSFVKVRDITLGYTLPTLSVQKFSIAKLRFYATLKNFFTFSHIGSYDPERGGSLSFPITKQAVIGLNVTFK